MINLRKVVIAVVLILILILVYFIGRYGIHLGIIDVFGVEEIVSTDVIVKEKVTKASALVSKDFPSNEKSLKEAYTRLSQTKDEYLQLSSVSTEAQIIQASELEEYEIEFLWARVGIHATTEGISIKMEVRTSNEIKKSSDGRTLYDLYFTTTGSYIGTALFVSALENDSDLEFKIESFKMTSATGGEVNSTFKVSSVAINNLDKVQDTQLNSQSSAVGGQTSSSGTNTINNTTNNTNTNTSTNTNTNTNISSATDVVSNVTGR